MQFRKTTSSAEDKATHYSVEEQQLINDLELSVRKLTSSFEYSEFRSAQIPLGKILEICSSHFQESQTIFASKINHADLITKEKQMAFYACAFVFWGDDVDMLQAFVGWKTRMLSFSSLHSTVYQMKWKRRHSSAIIKTFMELNQLSGGWVHKGSQVQRANIIEQAKIQEEREQQRLQMLSQKLFDQTLEGERRKRSEQEIPSRLPQWYYEQDGSETKKLLCIKTIDGHLKFGEVYETPGVFVTNSGCLHYQLYGQGKISYHSHCFIDYDSFSDAFSTP